MRSIDRIEVKGRFIPAIIGMGMFKFRTNEGPRAKAKEGMEMAGGLRNLAGKEAEIVIAAKLRGVEMSAVALRDRAGEGIGIGGSGKANAVARIGMCMRRE